MYALVTIELSVLQTLGRARKSQRLARQRHKSNPLSETSAPLRQSDIATVALAKKMKMGGKMMWIYKLADENGEVQFNWCSAHQIETIEGE